MGSNGFVTVTFQQLIDDGILEIGDGYRAKNNELGGSGPIFLRAGHVSETHIDFDGVDHFRVELAEKVRPKMAKVGDTIVTTKGNSTGRTSYVGPRMPPFVYSPHLSYWRSLDEGRLVGRFIRYWSQSPEFKRQLSGMKASTDMAPYLSLTDQRRLQVTLPPIATQRRIAHILGTLDDRIELNRRMNRTLEGMAAALFKSWFIDFDPVRAKAEGRDPALPKHLADLFPNTFQDSPLGPIPEGWEVGVLSDVLVELETGGRPRGGVSKYKTGIPSIGAESITGLGLFNYGKTKFVPKEFFDKMRRGHVKNRDVLLYKDGGRPGQFEPHVTMFGEGFPFELCAINEHVYRMQAKKTFGQNMLFFSLSSPLVMEEMRVKGTGVAIPGLNSTQVKSLTTLIPPEAIVQAFDSMAGPHITRILANCTQSRTLGRLRDTLLPKLLSGEIDESVLEQVEVP